MCVKSTIKWKLAIPLPWCWLQLLIRKRNEAKQKWINFSVIQFTWNRRSGTHHSWSGPFDVEKENIKRRSVQNEIMILNFMRAQIDLHEITQFYYILTQIACCIVRIFISWCFVCVARKSLHCFIKQLQPFTPKIKSFTDIDVILKRNIWPFRCYSFVGM